MDPQSQDVHPSKGIDEPNNKQDMMEIDVECSEDVAQEGKKQSVNREETVDCTIATCLSTVFG